MKMDLMPAKRFRSSQHFISEESTNNQMSISSLPLELLRVIFSHLPRTKNSDPFDSDFSALANALLVCTQWREVGEDKLLWRDAKIVINSDEKFAKFCDGRVPARFELVRNLEIAYNVAEQESVASLEEQGIAVHQLQEGLTGVGEHIQNISFFPLNLVPINVCLDKLRGAVNIGELNIFPIVTSKIRLVRAKTVHRETMLHTIFLKELLCKQMKGEIMLTKLDIRGMEVALVGPNGRDVFRGPFANEGVHLVYDNDNCAKELSRER